eukprot:CAMPEP_0116828826 /NCGR_PEP_ID=MMETSP0418-20121206/3859_1 /TAXON_ID=1158023 /ORGANISM="Astrosyne radiata, Strain 13vi08-1A" /LENGTH=178 /DNA_ID=CAMNT_0004457733 /DNA_START=486 /DNA_END=1022 /DNA_ORIENTATION=+
MGGNTTDRVKQRTTQKSSFISSNRVAVLQGSVSDISEEEEPVPPDEHHLKVHELPKKCSSNKRVSFLMLHVREYSQILGDHPCCATGPPVALGWEYQPERIISVDDYEATRASRKSKEDLKLSFDDRKEILAETCSSADVRRAQRRLHRENRERRCGRKAVKCFFQHPPQAVTATVSD